MLVCVYLPITDSDINGIDDLLKNLNPHVGLEVHRTVAGLADRLRQPSAGIPVTVLAPATSDQLDELLDIRELLSSTRVIVVLPNDLPGLNAKAHLLRPRFLGYADGPFPQVVSVANRILEDVLRGTPADGNPIMKRIVAKGNP